MTVAFFSVAGEQFQHLLAHFTGNQFERFNSFLA